MEPMFFKPFGTPALPAIPRREVRITAFGAAEGGTVPCTEAIAAAIDSLLPEGGRVVIPAGVWLTGAIHLQSHMALHLEEGATLRFRRELDAYLPPRLSSYEGIRCYRPSALLRAENATDIAVTGSGTLDGQGDAFWDMEHYRAGTLDLLEAGKTGRSVEERVYSSFVQGIRPSFLEWVRCERVLIEGVTFRNSPMWNLHPLWCRDVTVRGVRIDSPMQDRFHHSPNTDGINLDGCSRALIEHCTIFCGDDAICLKSGKDKDGRDAGYACEDVEVRNCRVLRSIGGITVGSETSGGIRNLYCHDLEMDDVCTAIWIKSAPARGGVIENLCYRNISARTAACEGIGLTLGYEGAPSPQQEATVPVIRNIRIEDFRLANGKVGIRLSGLPGHMPDTVQLCRVNVCAVTPLEAADITGLTLEDCRLGSCPDFVYSL